MVMSVEAVLGKKRFTDSMSSNFFLTDPSIPNASIYVPGQTSPIRNYGAVEDYFN
jgi:hypothetical protein